MDSLCTSGALVRNNLVKFTYEDQGVNSKVSLNTNTIEEVLKSIKELSK